MTGVQTCALPIYTSQDVLDGGGKTRELSQKAARYTSACTKAVSQFNRGQEPGGVNEHQPPRGFFDPLQRADVAPGYRRDRETGLLGSDPYWPAS